MANLGGSNVDDKLDGTSLNDLFSASLGNDSIFGFDGTDRVIYRENISKYSIKYLNGAVYIVKPDTTVDELHDIEQIKFEDDVFQLTEDHLTDAIGDTRPIDLMFSNDKKTYFLSTTLHNSELLNLDVLQSDSLTKSRIYLSHISPVSSAKVIQSDNGDILVLAVGSGTLSVTKINSNDSVEPLATFHLDNSDAVTNLSVLSASSENITFALSLWNGKKYLSRSYSIDSLQQSPEVSFLNQTDIGGDHVAYQLSNGSQAHIYVGFGPSKIQPIWGGSSSDTEVRIKILSAEGSEILTKTVGGDEFITETYRTSLITQSGKIVTGWIGLSYVEDEDSGMSVNGFRVRQEGYFFGAIFNPNEPESVTKFLVNENPEDNAIWSTSCELTGGELVFVWSSNADGSGCGVYARIFNQDGSALTDQFQVNSRNWDNQTSPIVVADRSGGFTVFWNDSYYGGAFQRFDKNGNPNLISITGTSKADVIFADEGDQQILGDGGNDSLSAGHGEDILIGGAGVDSLEGGAGDDLVFGGEGGDVIVGGHGEGNDSYDGGTGIDTVTYRSATSGIEVDLKDGYAESISSDAGIGSDTITNIENVIAGSYSDILKGDDASNSIIAGEGNDELYGRGGSDSLSGGVGNDTIDGGLGADDMYGGAGNDTYYVENAADKVYDVSAPGQKADAGGVDAVIASLNYKLGSFIENLTLTGTVGLTGTGNTLKNTLTGTSGDDTLDGMTGVDTLIGGAGDDTYVVDNVNDVVTEDSNAGTDFLRSSVSFTLGDNIENLTLTGTVGLTGTGNTLNNSLAGTSGNDTLNGMGGTDALIGNAGNDMLSGGQGSDSLDGGVGNDVLDGGVGDDALTGGAGNDTFRITGGTDAVLDLGNGGADVLNVAAGATANATVTAAWTATAATVNRGAASISTNGFAVNLSAVTTTGTNGFTVTNTTTTTGARVTLTGSGLNDALIGGSSNDTLVGNAGNDTLSGGIGLDALNGGVGADALDGGAGNDILVGGDGADTLAGGDGADSLTGGSGADVFILQGSDRVTDYDGTQGDTLNLTALVNGDAVTFTTVRGQLDLSSSSSTAAFIATANASGSTITGGAGADTLNGGNGVDVLTGGGGADRLNGGGGNDALRGGIGADTLTGGAGRDTFLFSEGDSGQGTGFDLVMDFAKGKVGTGDLIDYAVDLTRGGNADMATDIQASIHQTTGIATFASGSGTTLADALGDIAARFTAATDSVGEFGLFRVNNAGNYYMFISDGAAGVTANDVVVQLIGVQQISAIDLTGGNLTILT